MSNEIIYRKNRITFQSTPPAWGATKVDADFLTADEFQSTPPAWGATFAHQPPLRQQHYFNPRPPRGERLQYYQKNAYDSIIFCYMQQTLMDFSKNFIFIAIVDIKAILFSSASFSTHLCSLIFRTTKLKALPHQMKALLLYAPLYACNYSRDSKSGGCLCLCQ
jgi:hypothetical protein